MKQNIKYELNNGDIINVQFEFCFKCKYFEQCYEYGYASLISPECMEENKFMIIGQMREATIEERNGVRNYIESISESTGVNFFDSI